MNREGLWNVINTLMRQVDYTPRKTAGNRLFQLADQFETVEEGGVSRIPDIILTMAKLGVPAVQAGRALGFGLKSIRNVTFIALSTMEVDKKCFPGVEHIGEGVFANTLIKKGEQFYEVVFAGEGGTTPLSSICPPTCMSLYINMS